MWKKPNKSPHLGCFGRRKWNEPSPQKKPRKSVGEFLGLKEHAERSFKKKQERLKKYKDIDLEECTFQPQLKQVCKQAKRKAAEPVKKKHVENSPPPVEQVLVIKEEDILLEVNVPEPTKLKGEFFDMMSIINIFQEVMVSVRQLGTETICKDVVASKQVDEGETVDEKLPPEMNCSICLGGIDDNESNDAGDMIQLKSCQHYAHKSCLEQQLDARWAGKKITFNYLKCGECRTPLEHDTLALKLAPHLQLMQKVEELSLKQAQADDLISDLSTLMEACPREAINQCMAKLSCYMCSVCSEPFCGGRVDCAEDEQLDVSALKCPSCVFGRDNSSTKNQEDSKMVTEATVSSWRGKCFVHGYKFAIYKCDSCCAVATWDCRSNHYCTRCHDQASHRKDYKCPGESCPLGIKHPPNKPGVHGTVDDGFVIGCSKCFLGEENDDMKFELATDNSSRGAAENWKDRF